MDYALILLDDPRPKVRRITLNRPDQRNPLSNALRTELFDALEAADRDEGVAVIVIRGAGSSFCAGYDLKTNVAEGQPWHSAGGLGNWPRHVVEGCFRMWDLATPLIAQVHGYCLAGGTELATGCNLVYVAEDANMLLTNDYPSVRSRSCILEVIRDSCRIRGNSLGSGSPEYGFRVIHADNVHRIPTVVCYLPCFGCRSDLIFSCQSIGLQ